MDEFLDADTLVILYVLAGMLYVLLAWLAFFLSSDEILKQATGFPGIIFLVSIVAVAFWPAIFVVDAVTYRMWREEKKE